MKPELEMLAAYNAWVNVRLYDAALRLPECHYRADHGAFFGSLHRTLNHILVSDRIWMQRLTGEGEAPAALDAILHDDLPSLRRAREAEDGRISAYIAGLTEAALAGSVRYRSTRSPAEIEQRLAPLLIHIFNHQTHHRGQAHMLLTRITGEAPSFDLLMFQRETGVSLLSGQGGLSGAPERRAAPAPQPARRRVPAAAPYGERVGYSRAVRAGRHIHVSGTTASSPAGGALHPGDAGKQAEVALARIAAALGELGAGLEDVVETRLYLTDVADWEAVGRAHAAAFKEHRPATTMLAVKGFLGPDLCVEIAAVALIEAD